VLWYIAETVAIGVSWKLYDYGQEILPAGGTDEAAEWRKFVVKFSDSSSGDDADDQQFGLHIVNYTNGSIDNTWNQADFDNCNALIDSFVQTFLPYVCSRLSYSQLTAYRMAYNPYTIAEPFVDSGAPVFNNPKTLPGGTSGQIPPQPAQTVTFRTLTRRNWGRIYLPSLIPNAYTSSGRLTTTLVDALAAAAQAMVENLAATGMHIVVPATSVGGSKGHPGTPTRALQAIQAVAVDDVSDVIRRRRHKTITHRAVRPVVTTDEPSTQPSGSTSS
jgi:hypothetical protein